MAKFFIGLGSLLAVMWLTPLQVQVGGFGNARLAFCVFVALVAANLVMVGWLLVDGGRDQF